LTRTLLLGVISAIGVAGSSEATGQGRDLGSFGHWRAHVFVDASHPVCTMWSQPVKAEGKYSRRGEIFAFVTHRPTEGVRNKVSFELGYEFAPNRALEVRIGNLSKHLVTSGSTGWSNDPKQNLVLTKAMKRGRTMVVRGRSRRGNDTRDTYSLAGFSAAYRAISRACPRAGSRKQ